MAFLPLPLRLALPVVGNKRDHAAMDEEGGVDEEIQPAYDKKKVIVIDDDDDKDLKAYNHAAAPAPKPDDESFQEKPNEPAAKLNEPAEEKLDEPDKERDNAACKEDDVSRRLRAHETKLLNRAICSVCTYPSFDQQIRYCCANEHVLCDAHFSSLDEQDKNRQCPLCHEDQTLYSADERASNAAKARVLQDFMAEVPTECPCCDPPIKGVYKDVAKHVSQKLPRIPVPWPDCSYSATSQADAIQHMVNHHGVVVGFSYAEIFSPVQVRDYLGITRIFESAGVWYWVRVYGASSSPVNQPPRHVQLMEVSAMFPFKGSAAERKRQMASFLMMKPGVKKAAVRTGKQPLFAEDGRPIPIVATVLVSDLRAAFPSGKFGFTYNITVPK